MNHSSEHFSTKPVQQFINELLSDPGSRVSQDRQTLGGELTKSPHHSSENVICLRSTVGHHSMLSHGSVDHSDLLVNCAQSHGLEQLGTQTQYLLATVGRFQLAFNKTGIAHLLKLDVNNLDLFNTTFSKAGLLVEIRTLLQGHIWSRFPEIKNGYCVRFKGNLSYLYLESVVGLETIQSSLWSASSMTKRLPWVEAVAVKPLRLLVDTVALGKLISAGELQSRNIKWHE